MPSAKEMCVLLRQSAQWLQ